jgi:hypothetical protein
MAAETDMSIAYDGQVRKAIRGISIVNHSQVIIRDEIVNNQVAKTMQWRMLTPATVKSMGKDHFVLEQNGKTLTLKVLNGKGINMKTWSTNPPNDYDAENPGSLLVGFEVELNANEKRDFEVVLVPNGSKIPQKVSKRKWFD